MTEEIVFEELLHPGAAWTHVLKRGTALRMTDAQGGANVGAILYNNDQPTERLNIPDTLKAQHIARLTVGNALYSDMGRVLCSITHDTVGWHDPLSGRLNAQQVAAKYGTASYQEKRNDFHRNAHDGFLIELQKAGLGPRDLSPNINFFSKVAVSTEGTMTYCTNHSAPGSSVQLRAEMNVLVILCSCPHPLDPTTAYSPKSVNLAILRVDPPASDDACRMSCPENERGFVLTERYFL